MSNQSQNSLDYTNQSTHHETEIEHISPKNKEEEKCDIKKVIEQISYILITKNCENKFSKLSKKNIKNVPFQIFSSKFIPHISIGDYLNRIAGLSKVEIPTLIMAFIYLERFCKKTKIVLNEYNTHRLVIASLISSIKFNEDQKYNHEYYSLIAGATKRELGELEREFLFGLDFNMFIDENTYEMYAKKLCNY